ncbi:MAG: ATP-binding protein [Gammaproteobacteria bacterium]|nr:ATP-binding protein [Gammaproteobacteria bacterium]
MVLDTLRRLTSGPKPVALLFVLLLASLYLMSAATQNSATFGRLYSLLLGINILALLLLVALIARNLISLISQYRRRDVGSRLTTRLVIMFAILAVSPISVLYYFSLQFLHRGIDSWFDLRIESALEDALELGRSALDSRLRELLRDSRQIGVELAQKPDSTIVLSIHTIRQASDATEMTLLSFDGRVMSSSSLDPSSVIPALPNQAILQQLRHGLEYAALEPVKEHGLQYRIVTPITNPDPLGEPRLLHALYPIPERIDTLAASVQGAFTQYRELSFLRQPLKQSFTLTLSLVLLLSLLTAVWAAFFSARRLVAPIRNLAKGTRAVADGDYDMRLPLPGRDELGFLVRSFNEMTRKLARARDSAQQSQAQAEEQHAYLEAVLACLSSGVLTLNQQGRLHTVNSAAAAILGVDLAPLSGLSLQEASARYPMLEPLLETIAAHLEPEQGAWQAEVILFGASGRSVLICRGSALRTEPRLPGEHVIVFDDVTALIQAQRDAAWGEVARRLAHEIKNPLTPIQLSAERLRHKYLKQMSGEDAEVMDRATHTIVQQVESMKEMVNAFSDYARPPRLQLTPVALGHLIREVLDLYQGDTRLQITLDSNGELPTIEADIGRLRQLLHNLIKNAIEANSSGQPAQLRLLVHCAEKGSCRFVELRFEDNGPGISVEMLEQLFEPYITSKPKGTGLGLAVVKKIVEEHGGIIWVGNRDEGGAVITVRLPVHPKHSAQRRNNGTPGTAETGAP